MHDGHRALASVPRPGRTHRAGPLGHWRDGDGRRGQRQPDLGISVPGPRPARRLEPGHRDARPLSRLRAAVRDLVHARRRWPAPGAAGALAHRAGLRPGRQRRVLPSAGDRGPGRGRAPDRHGDRRYPGRDRGGGQRTHPRRGRGAVVAAGLAAHPGHRRARPGRRARDSRSPRLPRRSGRREGGRVAGRLRRGRPVDLVCPGQRPVPGPAARSLAGGLVHGRRRRHRGGGAGRAACGRAGRAAHHAAGRAPGSGQAGRRGRLPRSGGLLGRHVAVEPGLEPAVARRGRAAGQPRDRERLRLRLRGPAAVAGGRAADRAGPRPGRRHLDPRAHPGRGPFRLTAP